LKLITAVVRPETLDEVIRVLAGKGVCGVTATEVLGFGQQHGRLDTHQGAHPGPTLLPKVRLDIVASDEDAGSLLDAIVKSARTGGIGDGKIWLTSVESVVRVRTGERDSVAV
jgi:nitrogen regulatory protein P-II 1